MSVHDLAQELMTARTNRQAIATAPSGRDASFDLDSAYAVETEIVRQRKASGRMPAGRKVGFANKAMWRVLKLDTLVWAHMYDDTVLFANGNAGMLSLAQMFSPKIEPEIVFKMRGPISSDFSDPAAVLESVEWLALGFEIIDCAFPDWKFQPVDFVASFGLHAALAVGEPLPVTPDTIPQLSEQLAKFTVKLSRNGEVVAEGSGRNSLRSPALCLGELASAIARRTPDEPLAPGELVSSGTLTESMPIVAGETWSAAVEGLPLPVLTLTTT